MALCFVRIGLMKRKLVECVPNFSEGRRLDVVAKIVDSIAAVPGVLLLDHSSDTDHNRSVVTFAGEPDVVLEAAFAGVRIAAQHIDLDHHQGQHPRIGAADVVPFVPLENTTMAECVDLARRLGQRVGDELAIPVYLYEEAALRPERQQLEALRRGGYEALRERILTDPAAVPDYGPSRLPPAGACAIGARRPLLAFNVYLTTPNVEIARKIARTIRQSSGGFRYLKAMGVQVGGLAQVSMNFTNFARTPLPLVVETIRREAARYGVAIDHTEIIGLVPQAALVEAAAWYLQLAGNAESRVLETQLNRALHASEHRFDDSH